MPFIHPPPPSTMRTQKQPRRSFESEMAVEQELAHTAADRWRMPVQNAWGNQIVSTIGHIDARVADSRSGWNSRKLL
jgi:hypothetical protein